MKASLYDRICNTLLLGAALGMVIGVLGGGPAAHAQLSDEMLERELAAPSGMSATPGLGRIVVSWDASAEDGVLGYNVYRSPRYDGDYEAMASAEGTPFTTSGTTFVDSGLVVGETFFYRVTSVTPLQESAFSEIAGATVQQRALADFDTDFTLTPDAPSIEDDSPISLYEPQSLQDKGFFTGRRLSGIGFLVAGAAFIYKGFDFKDEADQLYDRYKVASDPTEIDRLYQRTTNRDVKSQISWALGAACTVAGVRLTFFDTGEEDAMPMVGRTSGPLQWHARVGLDGIGLNLSRSF